MISVERIQKKHDAIVTSSAEFVRAVEPMNDDARGFASSRVRSVSNNQNAKGKSVQFDSECAERRTHRVGWSR